MGSIINYCKENRDETEKAKDEAKPKPRH